MKVESGDLVMPGDFLGIVEQYLPGEGTFDDNGTIKSSIFGNVNLDLKNKQVSVSPLTGSPVILEKGDMVYAASEECAIRVIEPNPDRIWSPKGGEPVIITLNRGE